MDKIFEKIYSEKDTNTNISLFIASISSLIVYLTVGGTMLVIITIIGVFSLTKVVSKIFSNILIKNSQKTSLLNSFSNSEKSVIKEFIKKGTAFIPIKDFENITIEKNGFDSLLARGVIKFREYSCGEIWPTGFSLDELVYKNFLDK